MKLILSLILLLTSLTAFSQAPNTYFSLSDRKVYSLKNKGVRDFVVDVISPKLTEQVNEQKIFGKVKELLFRVHWTLYPERMAVDVIGLPDGFLEAKNELRASFMPILDNLLPMTVEQRFSGYKFSAGKLSREFMAIDPSGLAAIPKYVLKFDELDRLSEVIGMKPVGSWNMTWVYEKKAFSEGRWVISQITVTNSENGQSLKSTRKLNYGNSQGIGVLSEVVLTAESDKGQKSVDTFEFKNYRINTGEGMRYFLGDSPIQETKSKP